MDIINIINGKEVTRPQMLKDTNKYDLPKFLIDKINYLNILNYKDSTRENFLRVFINYILPYEMYRGKDLCFFDEKEILDIMNNLNTSSVRVKKNLESLINNYIDYHVTNGDVEVNAMKSVLKNLDRKVDKEQLNNKYISVEECFRMYDKILEKSNLTPQEAIVVLLARYSLTGKEMTYLDEECIDSENSRLIIKDDDENIARYIPIDNRMIERLNDAIKTIGYTKEITKVYVRNGFLLKPKDNRTPIVSYVAIRNRFSEAVKVIDKEYITIKDLNKSFLIDRLVEINDKNGCLYNDDIRNVLTMVNREGNSSYFSLKEDLSMIRPDIKVINLKSGEKIPSKYK